MKVGHKIKQLRAMRGITLNELAKKVELTTSFLSQLERDLTSPSVNSLERIAKGLGVKVADFFQEGERKELIIVKKGSPRRAPEKTKEIFVETLASGMFDINMRSQLFSLGKDAVVSDELSVLEGEKFMMVLKGAVEFFSDKKRFVFEEGDSVYCAANQGPYRIKNSGDKEAKVLYVSFLPV